jgi:putative phosphoribosyl transferase
MTKRFEDREQAGKFLAERLIKFQNLDPVILALPRGGVPVAHEISQKLHAPLDVVLVKKIGAPGHEEFAIGAVAEDERPILNQKVIKQYQFNPDEIESIIVDRISEIRRRAKAYRKNFPATPLKGRTVIIVDDGLATGATMLSAIEWLHAQKIKKIIVAVPVASSEAAEKVKGKVDEFISLLIPDEFWAVGEWYKDFAQVSDEEVIRILQKQTPISKSTTHDIWIEDNLSFHQGVLSVPPNARGLILFAHGGGSSHKSPRNIFVAKALNDAGFGTLLFDLLSTAESLDRKNVFDIELMSKRLIVATEWAKRNCPNLPIGYFGASTGAAAALMAAKERIDIFAIVSRGGRPDLALADLPKVYAPTLLLVGTEDKQVIPLNQLAKEQLTNAQLTLIPKATHLFEEPGTMEQVVEFAISWFSSSISLHMYKKGPVKENLIEEIEENSLPFSNANELDSWIKKISSNKIIMLGEATHGTSEFYSIRREISKKLIQNYGYNFIAVEGDWPACYNLNEYISNEKKDDAKEYVRKQFHRWPTWMWANEEIPQMINWMKKNQNAGFYGLDVYSLFESIEEVKKHLDHIEPALALKIANSYKCFESYNFDEIAYAKSLLEIPKGCQEEVVNNLRALLRLRLHETSLSQEALFDTKQNARIISNAEKYYRAMITGGSESWNVRDNHMMDTLENLLHLHGPDAKAIVWAHNTHIGDYHATDMLENGHINLGGLARERFGIENVFLLGFSTYQGTVTAGKSWSGATEKMNLPKARTGSYEDYFHQASLNMKAGQFLTSFDKLDANSSLYRTLGHRAVGVVYDPAHESRGNYVQTNMAKRYDGLIFVDQTTALESLPSNFGLEEIPETWPEGQ